MPKDNNKYKVLFTGEIRIETTDPLGGVACISIKGSEHDFVRICGGTKEYNNTFPNYINGSGEIIIGTDRKLHIQRASVWFGSLYFFRMIGYTKIV